MLKVYIILWIPSHCTGLFEVRAQDYLDSLPGAEHRGVNKFLKGLGKLSSTFQIKKIFFDCMIRNLLLNESSVFAGNKMKFLSKK